MLSGEGLVMETLFFPDEIRQQEDLKLDNIKVDERELNMALSLIDMLAGPFEPEEYQDEYRVALMERIEAKLQGKQIMEQPTMPEPRVIDLFDALKASLEAAKASKPSKRKSG